MALKRPKESQLQSPRSAADDKEKALKAPRADKMIRGAVREK
jgi:hypothetical protein